MTADSCDHRAGVTGHTATGWLVSCLLHGSLAIAAIFFVQQIQLAPQPEPFKWNVAMVEPSRVAALSSTTTSASAPTTSSNASPPATPATQPPAPIVALPARTPVVPVAPPPPMTEHAPTPPAPAKQEPNRETVREQASPSAPFTKPVPPAMEHQHSSLMTPQDRATEPAPASTTQEPSVTVPPVISPMVESQSLQSSPAQISEQTSAPHHDAASLPLQIPGTQVAAVLPTGQPKMLKSDYGWLADLMARWIEDLDKRYPAILRTEGIQGKVTLTAMLHEDGMLSDVRVAKSSGNPMLDEVAVEDVKKGPPIRLSRPLERPQMPVKFSLVYDLKTVH